MRRFDGVRKSHALLQQILLTLLCRNRLKLRLGRIEFDSLSGKGEQRLEQQLAINCLRLS